MNDVRGVSLTLNETCKIPRINIGSKLEQKRISRATGF